MLGETGRGRDCRGPAGRGRRRPDRSARSAGFSFGTAKWTGAAAYAIRPAAGVASPRRRRPAGRARSLRLHRDAEAGVRAAVRCADHGRAAWRGRGGVAAAPRDHHDHVAVFSRPTGKPSAVPDFAQLDNDTRFQGAHQHPDVFGRVVRFWLALGRDPGLCPPYEFGLQNAVESFNSLWQRLVWRRAPIPISPRSEPPRRATSPRAARNEATARPSPRPAALGRPGLAGTPGRLTAGCVIYIRRTTPDGRLRLLGHTWRVARHWAQRLVRAEVYLAEQVIRCFALSRRAPTEQPLLAELRYVYPRNDLIG